MDAYRRTRLHTENCKLRSGPCPEAGSRPGGDPHAGEDTMWRGACQCCGKRCACRPVATLQVDKRALAALEAGLELLAASGSGTRELDATELLAQLRSDEPLAPRGARLRRSRPRDSW